MDIRQLNELLLPYKIEIVCDSCQRKNDFPRRLSNDFAELHPSLPIHQTEKKQPSRISKVVRSFSNSKRFNKQREQPRPVANLSKSRRPQHEPQNVHPNNNRQTTYMQMNNSLINPPNQFLNLNNDPPEQHQRFSLHDILEQHRNTPHKIEDVNPEFYCYSDKKNTAFKTQVSHTTNNLLPLMQEGTPLSSKQRRRFFKAETPLEDKLALGSGVSRDASPFRPVFQRNSHTPSYLDQTPRNCLQFTPNVRGDQIDELPAIGLFSLLENPFEKSL